MRLHGDRGSSDALGTALIAPAMIGLALVVVFIGRGVDSRATVHGAAESAAQAAARERNPARATAAARDIGASMLIDRKSCATPQISVDVSDFRPGGIVAVTVTCSVADDGLELIAPFPDVRSTATAYATIDPYRAAEQP